MLKLLKLKGSIDSIAIEWQNFHSLLLSPFFYSNQLSGSIPLNPIRTDGHEEPSSFFLLFFRLALAVLRALESFVERGFAIIATVSDIERLHPILAPGRGRHCFHKVIHLQSPGPVSLVHFHFEILINSHDPSWQEARWNIFQATVPSFQVDAESLERMRRDFGALSTGFTPRDVSRLAMTVRQRLQRSSGNEQRELDPSQFHSDDQNEGLFTE